jgi:dihydrofolate reductase
MRKLIAGMKISLDGKYQGPEGYADWVDAWSDEYGMMPQVDACLLGAGMYPGYEQYWTAMQNQPNEHLPMTGKLPTPEELKWARFAARTPHYVVSSTLTSAQWKTTKFITQLDGVADLKRQTGKDIYLMGGGRLMASLLDAGLVDELRLILYPLIAGGENDLFIKTALRRALELQSVRQLQNGLINLIYKAG